MTELNEALKGLTDLPIALAALILGIILINKKSKNFGILFIIVFAAAILGTIAHTILMPKIYLRVTWVVLYILLFEAVRRFVKLFIDYIKICEEKEKPLVFILQAVLYCSAVVCSFINENYDIYFLVAFTVIMFLRLIASAIKFAPDKKAVILLALIILPILLQAFSELIPYSIVLEHIFILIALIYTFLLALSKKND